MLTGHFCQRHKISILAFTTCNSHRGLGADQSLGGPSEFTLARQQAHNLARQRRIVILRKGKAVEPEGPVKGVIRLALPEN